eukprot:GHVR01086867.1.p1 GENE.GHVR01086867.1~~GHVR01086867.1.p1  ORF type:complete len:144 (+),score=10.72 GHVR01086867.1:757-1188(+)
MQQIIPQVAVDVALNFVQGKISIPEAHTCGCVHSFRCNKSGIIANFIPQSPEDIGTEKNTSPEMCRKRDSTYIQEDISTQPRKNPRTGGMQTKHPPCELACQESLTVGALGWIRLEPTNVLLPCLVRNIFKYKRSIVACSWLK